MSLVPPRAGFNQAHTFSKARAGQSQAKFSRVIISLENTTPSATGEFCQSSSLGTVAVLALDFIGNTGGGFN
jgi:hypothetical protein